MRKHLAHKALHSASTQQRSDVVNVPPTTTKYSTHKCCNNYQQVVKSICRTKVNSASDDDVIMNRSHWVVAAWLRQWRPLTPVIMLSIVATEQADVPMNWTTKPSTDIQLSIMSAPWTNTSTKLYHHYMHSVLFRFAISAEIICQHLIRTRYCKQVVQRMSTTRCQDSKNYYLFYICISDYSVSSSFSRFYDQLSTH